MNQVLKVNILFFFLSQVIKFLINKSIHYFSLKCILGRPTLEKCQKVKAERELKAEIASLSTENILDDDKASSRGSRRTTRQSQPPPTTTNKRKRRIITSDDDEDEEDDGT